MQFNSFTFLIFFGIVLAMHYSPISWRFKKFNLLWASYLFYAAWNPPFVLLLWISTVVDWFVARLIYRTEGVGRRRLLLLLSLCTNLGILGFFKYGNFLLENFIEILNLLGVSYSPLELDIILPVGISFYTFQTLSYTIDVYRKKIEPSGSFLDFALFVTFFPQLVAGPILRARDFLPQCLNMRKASRRSFEWGLSLIVLGIFEKAVLADGFFAPVSDAAFAMNRPDFVAAWAGSMAFAGQVFCDFAGYSTCAIGTAMCLGFRVPDNFRFPYASIGFIDFWKRWHISLSSWLRDYVFYSMKGSRTDFNRARINMMLTMLIGGFWHGAAWNFIIWGGLHGFYLAVEHTISRKFAKATSWTQSSISRILLAQLTFLLFCVSLAFFRATDLGQSLNFLQAMFGLPVAGASSFPDIAGLVSAGIVLAAILVAHWRLRDSSLEEVAERAAWWVRPAAIGGMLYAIATMSGQQQAFIYFQF